VSRIDTQALKSQVDLINLIGRDVPLKKVSSAEYHGPCPFCGGDDRLLVREDAWTCRRCMGIGRGCWEDEIGYVQKKFNLPFREACEQLAMYGGLARVPTIDDNDAAQRPKPTRKREDPVPPDARWQARAERVIATCESALWSARGAKAREWLYRRGLKGETLKAWRVGLCLSSSERGCWLYGVWVWRGITIPWFYRQQIWAVNVRCFEQDAKYKVIKGSRRSGTLYGADKVSGKENCIFVEGEFDAMLLWQEVGDLADVLTLGSASAHLADRWLAFLGSYDRVWLATDSDAAGEQAARRLMQRLNGRARRVYPEGKDVTEAWQSGHDLRRWALGFLPGEITTLQNLDCR